MGKRTEEDSNVVTRSFWRGMSRGLLTPIPGVTSALRTGIASGFASPVGLAAIALAGTFLIAFVGAIIGSASLALLGGALVGLGAFGVRASEQVRESFMSTARRIDNSLSRVAENLVPEFVNAINLVGDFFDERLAPRLKNIFLQIGPAIEPLFEGALEAVDAFLAEIEPEIGNLTNEFLIPMARQFPRLGQMMGEFFALMIDHAPIMIRSFRGILDLVELLLRLLGPMIVAAAQGFNFFAAAMRPVLNMLRLMQNVLNDMSANPLAPMLRGWRSEADNTKVVFRDFSEELVTGNTKAGQFADTMGLAGRSMAGAVVEAGSLTDALAILTGGALATRAAARQFEEAIDAAKDTLKEHGLELDTNTEKGREVEAAIDAIAEAAIREADAVFEATKDTEGLDAAQAAANEVLREGRQRLIDTLAPFFDSREAARKYVNQILKIPENWRTDAKFKNEAALKRIRNYIEEIRSIPSERTTTATTIINRFIQTTHRAGEHQLRRHGGVSFARHGLLNLSGTAQLFPDGANLFGFAERGTGGEAFIARNASRSRSLGILDTAARWHRAVVVPMERAATTVAASMGGPTTSRVPQLVEIPIQIGNEVARVVRVNLAEHEARSMDRLADGAAA